jgi:anti-sigma regulatory factor (Ser/Thr protein kinase)
MTSSAGPRLNSPRCLSVQDSSHVGEARRLTSSLCFALGFSETRTAQAGLVVTELATNLVKHTAGAGGDLIFRPFEQSGAIGLEVLSVDRGPGIANIGECLRDGHSTAGSLGTGLGAVRRQSSAFDIYSAPGQGAAVVSRLWRDSPPVLPSELSVGAVCLPVRGEQACGDAWTLKAGRDTTLFMLADGLGHGPEAAAASNLATAIFDSEPPRSPAELVHLINIGLRSTRGAAVAVAEVGLGARVVRYAGVGNITGRILSAGGSRSMVSNNGTAGVEVRKVHEFSYPWPDDGILVLHSDGVAAHWSLDDYPGLPIKDAGLIAGVLFRDHQRLRDDSLVVVAKESGRGRVM